MSITTNYALLNFTSDNWIVFVKRLNDLAKVGNLLKLKIDNSNIFAYSVATATNNANKHINAFKGVILDINEICSSYSSIPDTGIDYIIIDAKNFVKLASFFVDDNNPIELKLEWRNTSNLSNKCYMSNGILNIQNVGGANIAIKDITYDAMIAKTDATMCNFSFDIDSDKLNRIRKLAASTATESIQMWTKNGKLYFGENKWSLDVADCNESLDKIQFNKKYLNAFEPSKIITIDVFDVFISVNQDNTVLLIGLELDEL